MYGRCDHEGTAPRWAAAVALLALAWPGGERPCRAAESPNLLFNGGFEQFDAGNGMPAGWFLYAPGAKPSPRVEKAPPLEGGAAVLLQTDGDVKAILVSDRVAVAPGEVLHLRVRCRAEGLSTGSGGTLALSAGFLDAGGSYFAWHRAQPEPEETDQWISLATAATVPPGAAYATFQIGLNRMTGRVCWDGAELTTESPVAVRFDLPAETCPPGTSEIPLVLLSRDPRDRDRRVVLSVTPGDWNEPLHLVRPSAELTASVRLDKRGRNRLAASVRDASSGAVLFSAERVVTVPPLLETEPPVPTHFCVEDGRPRCEGRLWVHEEPAARETLGLVCSLRRGDRVLSRWTCDALPANPIRYDLSLPEGVLGDYSVDIVLRRGGAVAAGEVLDWHVIRSDRARVAMGGDGFPRVDGEPFFPIGLFNGGRFAELAAAGFNVTHGYNAMATRPGRVFDNHRAKRFLDDSAAAGMKTLLLVTHGSHGRPVDEEFVRRVRMFRNHPALLAWDEEEGVARAEMPLENLARMREVLDAEDRRHPFMVGDARRPIFEIHDRAELFPDEQMDMGMWWWYPFPLSSDRPSDPLAGEDPAENRELVPPEFLVRAKTAKPIWVGLQAYRKPGRSDGRFPTPAEYRAQAYLAVIHGAKGLMYYVGSGSGGNGILNRPEEGHWEDLKRLVAELREMAPVFLSPDADPQPEPEPAGVPISLRAKRSGCDLVILAANRGDRVCDVDFRLPGQRDRRVTVRFEQRDLPMHDGRFRDRFAPYGVHVYQLGGSAAASPVEDRSFQAP